MISDFDLYVTKFISVPKDMGQLNCAAFVAGIVKGALDGAGFPARYQSKHSAAFLSQAEYHQHSSASPNRSVMNRLNTMQGNCAFRGSQGCTQAKNYNLDEV